MQQAAGTGAAQIDLVVARVEPLLAEQERGCCGLEFGELRHGLVGTHARELLVDDQEISTGFVAIAGGLQKMQQHLFCVWKSLYCICRVAQNGAQGASFEWVGNNKGDLGCHGHGAVNLPDGMSHFLVISLVCICQRIGLKE